MRMIRGTWRYPFVRQDNLLSALFTLMKPNISETRYFWDPIFLRPNISETRYFWDLIFLRPNIYETQYLWDPIFLRPDIYETRYLWDQIFLRPDIPDAWYFWCLIFLSISVYLRLFLIFCDFLMDIFQFLFWKHKICSRSRSFEQFLLLFCIDILSPGCYPADCSCLLYTSDAADE